LVESAFLLLRHGTGCDRKSLSIGKLDNDTEEVAARYGLSQDVIDRIFA